jgi:hypothetical protein
MARTAITSSTAAAASPAASPTPTRNAPTVPRSRGGRCASCPPPGSGYNARDLSANLGMSVDYVAKLRTDKRHLLVRRETHDAVCRVYDLLWDKRRTDTNARRTMTLAARLGYLPPMSWDDDTIDEMDKKPIYKLNPERDNNKDTSLPKDGPFIDEIAVSEAVAGRPVTLTKPEMTEAMVRLTRMGYSAKQIAEQLGTTTRRVTRRRSETRRQDAA